MLQNSNDIITTPKPKSKVGDFPITLSNKRFKIGSSRTYQHKAFKPIITETVTFTITPVENSNTALMPSDFQITLPDAEINNKTATTFSLNSNSVPIVLPDQKPKRTATTSSNFGFVNDKKVKSIRKLDDLPNTLTKKKLKMPITLTSKRVKISYPKNQYKNLKSSSSINYQSDVTTQINNCITATTTSYKSHHIPTTKADIKIKTSSTTTDQLEVVQNITVKSNKTITDVKETSGSSGSKRKPTKSAKKLILSGPKSDDFKIMAGLIARDKRVEILFTSNVIKNKKKLALQFGVSTALVNIILKHKQHILQDWKYNTASDKTLSLTELQSIVAINKVLIEWKRRCLHEGLTITDKDVMCQASYLKKVFLLPKFNISKIWLEKFNINSEKPPLLPKSEGYSLDIIDIVSALNAKSPQRSYENFKISLSEQQYPCSFISKTYAQKGKKKNCNSKYINGSDVNCSSESDVEEIVQPVEVVDITDDCDFDSGGADKTQIINDAVEDVVQLIKSEDIKIENEALIQEFMPPAENEKCKVKQTKQTYILERCNDYSEISAKSNASNKNDSKEVQEVLKIFAENSKAIVNKNYSNINKSIEKDNVENNVEKELDEVDAINGEISNVQNKNELEDENDTIEVLRYMETDSEDDEIFNCNEITMKEENYEKFAEDLSSIKSEDIISEGEEFISIVAEKKHVDDNGKSNATKEKVNDIILKKDSHNEDDILKDSQRIDDREDENYTDYITLNVNSNQIKEKITLNMEDILNEYDKKSEHYIANRINLMEAAKTTTVTTHSKESKSQVATFRPMQLPLTDYNTANMYLFKLKHFAFVRMDTKALEIIAHLKQAFNEAKYYNK